MSSQGRAAFFPVPLDLAGRDDERRKVAIAFPSCRAGRRRKPRCRGKRTILPSEPQLAKSLPVSVRQFGNLDQCAHSLSLRFLVPDPHKYARGQIEIHKADIAHSGYTNVIPRIGPGPNVSDN